MSKPLDFFEFAFLLLIISSGYVGVQKNFMHFF